MPIEDICSFPVIDLAAKDSVLALWAISPMLPDALRVMESWGFRYKTVLFVWVKGRIGLGYYTRAGAELCLLGTRGGLLSRIDRGVPQVIHAKPREHSRKPDEAAERLERLFGDIPRIELFARAKRPGWEVWGDELTCFNLAQLFNI